MNKTITIGAVMAMAATSGFAGDRDIERKFACDKKVDIQVINAVGDIEVTGERTKQCRVYAKLGAQAKRLEVKERGDRITIEVIYDGSKWRDNGTRLMVYVPHSANLKVNGVSSDVEVEGVNGVLALQSVSGDITVETKSDAIWANTTSGDVDIEGGRAPGKTDASSTSGSVEVSDVAGRIDASSVSGSVDISDSALHTANLNVISGHIDVNDALLPNVDLEAETVSGGLDINVASNFAGDVAVSTLNGGIDNCFGPKPQRTSRYGPGKTLVFDRGDGDGRINLSSVNGSIHLCTD
ncbi:MAG: DUF4097 domain-containing protein [Woeseiaceae bacterium]